MCSSDLSMLRASARRPRGKNDHSQFPKQVENFSPAVEYIHLTHVPDPVPCVPIVRNSMVRDCDPVLIHDQPRLFFRERGPKVSLSSDCPDAEFVWSEWLIQLVLNVPRVHLQHSATARVTSLSLGIFQRAEQFSFAFSRYASVVMLTINYSSKVYLPGHRHRRSDECIKHKLRTC